MVSHSLIRHHPNKKKNQVEEDRIAMEKSLEEAAKQAASEQGDEKDDHDNRKMKKADRMRLVKLNKVSY